MAARGKSDQDAKPAASSPRTGNLSSRHTDRRSLVRANTLESRKGSLSRTLRDWGYGLDLYNWRLTGRHPLKLETTISDVRMGDVAYAQQFMTAILSGANPEEMAKRYWQGKLDGFTPDHRFEILIDLNALSNDSSTRLIAFYLVKAWCDDHMTWKAKSWAADILADRLFNWLVVARLVLGSDDLVYRSRVLLAIARQMRHLPRVVADILLPHQKIRAASALALAGLLLPDNLSYAQKGFKLLADILRRYVLADGAPTTRHVPTYLEVLCDLTLVRRAALAREEAWPDDVQQALDRIGPFIAALRMGDMGFAGLFGASPTDSYLADHLMDVNDQRAQPIASLPYGGLQRLVAGGNIALLDTGPAPKGSISASVGASTGALAFSSGRERIFVQVGPSDMEGMSDAWRTSAAFSTAVLDNRNLTEIKSSSAKSRATAKPGEMGLGVHRTNTTRRALKDVEEISLTHDGYVKRLGYELTRLVRLSRDGLILSGEERLMATRGSAKNAGLDVRFHLHPDLSVHIARDGEVVIVTPSRKIWVFEAKGADIRLEESLYCPNRESVRQTSVIVLNRPNVKTSAKPLNWSLTRKE